MQQDSMQSPPAKKPSGNSETKDCSGPVPLEKIGPGATEAFIRNTIAAMPGTLLVIKPAFDQYYRLNFYAPGPAGTLIRNARIVRSLFVQIVRTAQGLELVDLTRGKKDDE